VTRGAFRSFTSVNYRIWACGTLVSNIGTWMQRVSQDWLVLTQLTHNNAIAVGITMALQYGPHVLLLPWTGFAADHFNLRKLLFVTQATSGALAFAVGVLTITHLVQLWHVYVFAFLLGCVTAFDAPARQTFVAELVREEDLANAVGLNSTSFNVARMVGPALAGGLIVAVGSGGVFLINGVSFVAVLVSLLFLRVGALQIVPRAARAPGSLGEGFRYVARRADLRATLLMLLLIGTFGLNFPIFISTMVVHVFHANAGKYGLLTSILAIGTVAGALLAAGRNNPSMRTLLTGALLFGGGCAMAAVSPDVRIFAVALVIIGVAALTFVNSTTSLLQIATAPEMRGRVMAIRLAITVGGTPVGAPIVGWVADHYGPRWALGIGAASGLAAAGIAVHHLSKSR